MVDDGGPDRERTGLIRLAMILVLSNTIPPHSSMRLTFVNDLGQAYSVDIDSEMELENVMALLEAEVSCPLQAHRVDSPISCFSLQYSPGSQSMSRVSHTRDGN